MTWFRLPTNTDERFPFYKQNTVIQGREYILSFQWNGRNRCWYLSVLDQDESPIFYGKPLLLGEDLLLGETDPRLPTGKLFVTDLQGTGQEAGLTELGGRVLLYFVD